MMLIYSVVNMINQSSALKSRSYGENGTGQFNLVNGWPAAFICRNRFSSKLYPVSQHALSEDLVIC